MRNGNGRAREGGFTYIGLLVLIAVLGYLLAVAGQVAATTAQREREIQLLFIGHAYRDAIQRYVVQNGRYPAALADLVEFPSANGKPAHYLRRLYPDPMAQDKDWQLVPALGGGIMGIASSSKQAPIKHSGFDDADIGFGDADTYSDWIFIFDFRRRWGQGPQGVHGITTVQPTQQSPTQQSP
jgi:type II secretory pathway pseudopilin PulG